MSLKSALEKLVNNTDLDLSEIQINQLIQYVELLNKWNKAYNLTSVRDPQEMLIKHIMDSLMVGPVLTGTDFIDVGTGAGLPGIPLAILYPKRNFVLLDSLGKRITFLRQVVFQLKLENVTPVLSRVENYQEQQFDGVLSRAFASLLDMINWCQHLPNSNGKFYALKGVEPTEELASLPKNIQLKQVHQINIPLLDAERHVIELIKI
ncbi:MAG: 16S rRNA (guanine(527)-N(7))-methyltransferase RsmG [Thalassotalea sp.]